MPNRVIPSFVFDKYFKKYRKKYASLQNDLEELEKQLLENPKLGIDLGDNLYKIRLAVKSKGKGKSGGFRVVSYLLTPNEKDFDINLVILYDKSDIDSITKKELLDIVKQIFD